MDDMRSILDLFLNMLLSVLPKSPFADAISALEQLPYLGYLNWFIPVGQMLAVGVLWLAAIALYYVYSVIARWVKLIS